VPPVRWFMAFDRDRLKTRSRGHHEETELAANPVKFSV